MSQRCGTFFSLIGSFGTVLCFLPGPSSRGLIHIDVAASYYLFLDGIVDLTGDDRGMATFEEIARDLTTVLDALMHDGHRLHHQDVADILLVPEDLLNASFIPVQVTGRGEGPVGIQFSYDADDAVSIEIPLEYVLYRLGVARVDLQFTVRVAEVSEARALIEQGRAVLQPLIHSP